MANHRYNAEALMALKGHSSTNKKPDNILQQVQKENVAGCSGTSRSRSASLQRESRVESRPNTNGCLDRPWSVSSRREFNHSRSQNSGKFYHEANNQASVLPSLKTLESRFEAGPHKNDKKQKEQEVLNFADVYFEIITLASVILITELEELEKKFTKIPPNLHQHFINEIFYLHVKRETSKEDRLKVGKLFVLLIKKNLLDLAVLYSAIRGFLNNNYSTVRSEKKLRSRLVEALYEPLVKNVLSLTTLRNTCHFSFFGNFWLATLEMLKEEKGTVYSIAFCEETQPGKGIKCDTLTYSQIYEKLNELVQSNASLEDIYKWAEETLGLKKDDRIKDEKFIRVVCTVYIENAIVDKELDTKTFENYFAPLYLFIDKNKEFELECLYAVEEVWNKLDQPDGLASKIFFSLYDGCVISIDTFDLWKRSEESGKNKSILVELESFFTDLREDSDSDLESP